MYDLLLAYMDFFHVPEACLHARELFADKQQRRDAFLAALWGKTDSHPR